MDPISHHLTHWVRFISRLATLSISMHQGYHSARTTLASFLSLFGTIFRALANLSRSLSRSLSGSLSNPLSHSHFGLGLPFSLGSTISSRLQAQDLLLLLWALLRLLRHHLLRRLLRGLVSHLPLGYLPADFVGFFARMRPALELPGWLRQLASAPPPLPPLLPSAAAAALPFGPSSSVLSSAPSFGLPGLPASTPWHLANYRQGFPLPPPPYMQGHVYGQPTGYYAPAPPRPRPPAAAVAVPPAPSLPPSLPPSIPPSGQLYGQLPGPLAPRAPFAPMSAPASGPPAVPAQTPGLHHLRQLRQQRQLQQSQSGPESGGGEGGGTPR
ncbi:hypothetical protein QR685DRAFT_120531 [Neurospora intermedia]|uniref:Uncharacterized protein n=1 Tax=Neurospora intermedia TaxID=5142 RepID=A0ABR3D0A0_NEUIN